jgi:hypothetical protein
MVVHSLQHDGILASGAAEEDDRSVAAAMSQAASARCGYNVKVDVK